MRTGLKTVDQYAQWGDYISTEWEKSCVTGFLFSRSALPSVCIFIAFNIPLLFTLVPCLRAWQDHMLMQFKMRLKTTSCLWADGARQYCTHQPTWVRKSQIQRTRNNQGRKEECRTAFFLHSECSVSSISSVGVSLNAPQSFPYSLCSLHLIYYMSITWRVLLNKNPLDDGLDVQDQHVKLPLSYIGKRWQYCAVCAQYVRALEHTYSIKWKNTS